MSLIATPSVGKGVDMKMAIAYLVHDLHVYAVLLEMNLASMYR